MGLMRVDCAFPDIEGTDLLSDEHLSDINDIAAVMKLWFREMPEPLFTWELYQGFIEASSRHPSPSSLLVLFSFVSLFLLRRDRE
jgi:hypothetical protein